MKYSATPPAHARIAYDIASRIASGELREGEHFSGRSLMGAQYGVSPETIRRAMRHLSDMGIISTQAQSGSRVLSRERATEYIEQFEIRENLRELRSSLRDKLAERDRLNAEITGIMQEIADAAERFHSIGRLRTYEFEVDPGSAAEDQSIDTLRFRQHTGATIVALRRGGEVTLSPDPKTVLRAGDALLVVCELSQTDAVAQLVRSP